MNPKNEWLDNQVKMLRLDEKKEQKKDDTKMLLKFLCLLLPLLLYAISLHAGGVPVKDKPRPRYVKAVDGGVHWTCKRCRTAQWQDKRNADWRGDFYCRQCGCRMGDE